MIGTGGPEELPSARQTLFTLYAIITVEFEI